MKSQFSMDLSRFDGVFAMDDLLHMIESIQPLVPLHRIVPDTENRLLRLDGLRLVQEGRRYKIEIESLAAWIDRSLVVASSLSCEVAETSEWLYIVGASQKNASGNGLTWSAIQSELQWECPDQQSMRLAHIQWDGHRPTINPYWWPELACIASDPRSVSGFQQLNASFGDVSPGMTRKFRTMNCSWSSILADVLDQQYVACGSKERSLLSQASETLEDGQLVKYLIDRSSRSGEWPQSIGGYTWQRELEPVVRRVSASGCERCTFELPAEVDTSELYLAVNCEVETDHGCMAVLDCGTSNHSKRPLKTHVPRIVGQLSASRFDLELSGGRLVRAAIYA